MESAPLMPENSENPRYTTKNGGWLQPFQKGKSGNPGGRTQEYKDCVAAARTASVSAMEHLIRLMESTDERVALMAADKVLERAWGKVKEQKDDPKPPLDLSRAPPEALELIRQALRMFAQAAPKQEVIPPEESKVE